MMHEVSKMDRAFLLATAFGLITSSIISIYRNNDLWFSYILMVLGIFIIGFDIYMWNERKKEKST